jgi:hypothetical protein
MGLLPERLARLIAVRDFRGVNAEEADAELGALVGIGYHGVAVRHAFDGGERGASSRGEGRGREPKNNESE